MRKFVFLMSATALSACSGQGPVTVGGNAVIGNTSGATTAPDTFVAPTTTKTYGAQGNFQSYNYTYNESLHYKKIQAIDPATGQPQVDGNGNPVLTQDPNTRTVLTAYQNGQLFVPSSSTVRSPGTTVTYDPKTAQFTLVLSQDQVAQTVQFQDPAHRTDFSGATTPQAGVPNLEIGDPLVWRKKGVQYLQVDSGSSPTTYNVTTFFYELPGTTTSYVTYAGFVRNFYGDKSETVNVDTPTDVFSTASRQTKLDRGAFVWGQLTDNNAVPKTGTGSFSGNMIASMVNNPLFDTDPLAMTYYQWISGTADVSVNFQTGAVSTTLNGIVGSPLYDPSPIFSPTTNSAPVTPPAILAGSTFTATSTAQIDLVKTGGFTGSFNAASFAGASTGTVDIVGSTIDGAFYGPKANELGASFNIVGGIPDQRVDIVGAFTGKGH